MRDKKYVPRAADVSDARPREGAARQHALQERRGQEDREGEHAARRPAQDLRVGEASTRNTLVSNAQLLRQWARRAG